MGPSHVVPYFALFFYFLFDLPPRFALGAWKEKRNIQNVITSLLLTLPTQFQMQIPDVYAIMLYHTNMKVSLYMCLPALSHPAQFPDSPSPPGTVICCGSGPTWYLPGLCSIFAGIVGPVWMAVRKRWCWCWCWRWYREDKFGGVRYTQFNSLCVRLI